MVKPTKKQIKEAMASPVKPTTVSAVRDFASRERQYNATDNQPTTNNFILKVIDLIIKKQLEPKITTTFGVSRGPLNYVVQDYAALEQRVDAGMQERGELALDLDQRRRHILAQMYNAPHRRGVEPPDNDNDD